ncbi:MAG TPA: rod shape-determining protein MreD [Gaiellaceae bacterium]|jgi:rod shape-determining protein MreD|nr:rod shape-determining protein MreD [Gaiellaceae bacterium]
MTIDALKAAGLLFVAAMLQVSIVGSVHIAGGTPDLVLVTLVAISLLRGAIVGALAGFFVGLLLDTAYLGRIGETSFLLTIAGYWIGRYGETTGRDRSHAPLLSVGVITILYAAGALALHIVLGDPVDARLVMLDSLVPGALLNLLLTVPVYAVVRRILGRPEWSPEVRLLG